MAQERKNRTSISPGDRFGRLTVLYDTGERQNHRTVWECRCICGNQIKKTSNQLTRNKNLSCGCDDPQQKLVGRRFGSLTVVRNTGKHEKTYILWDCLCDCGKVCQVNSHRLLSGQVTDCGCASRLIGRKFGRLTVIGDEGTQTGSHVWLCQCECGNKCLATSSHLDQGKVKSCGCLHDTVGRESLRLVDGTSVTKLEARRANSGRLSAANTSGYNGVYPQNSHGKRTGRWTAQIGFKGRKYNLGTFDRIEDAAAARMKAEERLYDGFIDWYYKEYLPAQKAVNAAAEPHKKRIYSEQRPAEAAAAAAAAP